MEKNQSKNSMLSWIAIDLAFIAVIVFLLLSFLHSNGNKTRQSVNDRVGSYVSAWGTKLEEGAGFAVSTGRSIKEYIDLRGNDYTPAEAVAYAKSVVSNTDTTHILFCKGNEALLDEDGKRHTNFDLSFCQKTAEIDYYFLTETSFNDDLGYFVTYIPFDSGRYILIYTSIEDVEASFKKSDFDDASFLGIVDLYGETVCIFPKYKDHDSEYLTGSNLFNVVKYSAVNRTECDEFMAKLRRGSTGAVRTDYNGDKRTIAGTKINVGNKNWSIIYGVRQQNIDRLIEANSEDARMTVLKFAIVMVAFSIFVVITVITGTIRNREHGRALEDKADTDLLTDLYNKAATERKIQEYLEQNPNGRGLMFILDIDNFKKINDTMGHAFGDTLLKTLGKEIKAEFRVSDIIGRTGGDEFMVFLKNVNDDVIVEREANRITKFFQDFKAGGDYVKYSATASIGAAIYPDDAKSFKDLYVAADQALYKAKKRGKNQLVFYNEEEK